MKECKEIVSSSWDLDYISSLSSCQDNLIRWRSRKYNDEKERTRDVEKHIKSLKSVLNL